AEVLAVGADPQAVVAARAPGGWNDRESAGDGTDLGALAGPQLVKEDASRPRPAKLVECPGEPTEVVVTQRRRDVDPARRLAAAVHDTREGTDDDVGDPFSLERLEDRVRVERGRLLAHGFPPRRSVSACTLCGGACRTLSASSASSTGSSARSTIATLSAKPQASTIATRFSKLGSCPPVSQRATCARSRARRSASCACVRPAFSRASRMICAAVNAPELYLALSTARVTDRLRAAL